MSFQENRNRLQILFQSGTTDSETLLELSGMARATFFRNYSVLLSGGSLARQPGGGRPRKLGVQDRRVLTGIALNQPMFSAKKINHRFREKTGKIVSTSTIERKLRIAGVGKKLPKNVPAISPLQEQKRLAFSREWKNYHFQDVFYHRRVLIPASSQYSPVLVLKTGEKNS
jgi:hypothetical protein